jgi:hypothetical protein
MDIVTIHFWGHNTPFLFIFSSRLRSGRSPRDPIKSNFRLAPKVIIIFHPSFYCIHELRDKPVIYSGSVYVHFDIPYLDRWENATFNMIATKCVRVRKNGISICWNWNFSWAYHPRRPRIHVCCHCLPSIPLHKEWPKTLRLDSQR